MRCVRNDTRRVQHTCNERQETGAVTVALSQLCDLRVQRPSLFLVLKATVSYPGSWLRGTVVERRSLAGELSLSCARPAAAG